MVSKYWGAVAILLSFYLPYNFIGDPKIIRDILFFACALFSIFLFDTKSKPLFIIGIILYVSAFSYNSIGFLYHFMSVVGGLIAYSQLRKEPIQEKHLSFLVCLLAVYSSIWGILNYFKIEPYHWFKFQFFINPEIIMSGPLLNHTISSIYCALAIPFLPLWLIPVVGFALFCYGSTMSILGAIFAFLHFHLDKKELLKWWLYPIGVVVLFFLFGSNEFFSGQERLAVWKNTVEWIPLTGKGLGYFHDFYSQNYKHTQVFLQEHNELLSFYSAFGIAGVLAFLFIVFSIIWSSPSKAKSASLAFVFISLGSFPLHISSLAIIGILLYTLTIKEIDYGFFSNKST